ncbi:MAG: ABC transporter permease [Microthrixaceae bacterium]
MTTTIDSPTGPPTGARPAPPAHPTLAGTFVALLLRDLTVLRKNLKEFLPRTILQPLLLVFVFTYVFPKIGQSVGGAQGSAAFSTLLVAGVIGTAILFQGIQSVALPLVQEFGYTREIEDRVLAPLPIELVAIEKIVAGALQCLISALIVFPIAKFVPATPVDLKITWWVLLTLAPLACVFSASIGLLFGTVFQPRTVPLLFGVIIVPMTFLGCVYYSWQSLEPIPWLQYAVLINPLVYICEGFRAALTPVDHMPLPIIYGVIVVGTVAAATVAIRFFQRRVIT